MTLTLTLSLTLGAPSGRAGADAFPGCEVFVPSLARTRRRLHALQSTQGPQGPRGLQGDREGNRSSADLGGELSADSISSDSSAGSSADSISIWADSGEARGRQLAEGLLLGAFSADVPVASLSNNPLKRGEANHGASSARADGILGQLRSLAIAGGGGWPQLTRALAASPTAPSAVRAKEVG